MTAPVAPRRVTVVGPSARVDVSLPPQSRVAELVPMLTRMTAGERAGTGWTLGRIGADPLDESSTVAGVGIQDGDLLYLNPRDAQPVPPVFDDVVDAVASAAADPRGIWRPALSRVVGLGAALFSFGAAAVLVAALRPPWPVTTAVDGALALVLLLGAAALARAFGDAGAGAALAGAGLPASALAGAALVMPEGASPFAPGPGGLAAGCAVLALYSVVAGVVVADRVAWFAAAAVAAATGCAAALVTAVIGARAVAVAAVVSAGALLVSPMLPVSALRLSRLPLPRVANDPAAFRRDEPGPHGLEVLERTRTAAGLLTGALAAVALVAAGATVVLLASAQGSAWARALAGLAVLGIGVVCLAYGKRAPAERPSPYWTRLLDGLEFVALVSLVPLAGAVIGWYHAARSLGG